MNGQVFTFYFTHNGANKNVSKGTFEKEGEIPRSSNSSLHKIPPRFLYNSSLWHETERCINDSKTKAREEPLG